MHNMYHGSLYVYVYSMCCCVMLLLLIIYMCVSMMTQQTQIRRPLILDANQNIDKENPMVKP